MAPRFKARNNNSLTLFDLSLCRCVFAHLNLGTTDANCSPTEFCTSRRRYVGRGKGKICFPRINLGQACYGNGNDCLSPFECVNQVCANSAADPILQNQTLATTPVKSEPAPTQAQPIQPTSAPASSPASTGALSSNDQVWNQQTVILTTLSILFSVIAVILMIVVYSKFIKKQKQGNPPNSERPSLTPENVKVRYVTIDNKTSNEWDYQRQELIALYARNSKSLSTAGAPILPQKEDSEASSSSTRNNTLDSQKSRQAKSLDLPQTASHTPESNSLERQLMKRGCVLPETIARAAELNSVDKVRTQKSLDIPRATHALRFPESRSIDRARSLKSFDLPRNRTPEYSRAVDRLELPRTPSRLAEETVKKEFDATRFGQPVRGTLLREKINQVAANSMDEEETSGQLTPDTIETI